MANLRALGIQKDHPGAYDGAWRKTSGAVLASENPATGAVLGTVRQASAADYEACAAAAHKAFERWRMVPAPKRGEYVRRIGNALREHKDELGALVTAETGKILQEGLGEVQEAIDIADFAVGLSRQLYGLSMHSERPLMVSARDACKDTSSPHEALAPGERIKIVAGAERRRGDRDARRVRVCSECAERAQ